MTVQRTTRPLPLPESLNTARRPAVCACLVLALLATVLQPLHAQSQPARGADAMRGVTDRLELEIRRAMAAGGIPSVAVALVNRDSILYSAAFGESNVWAQTPARTETVYLIGSTFKAQSTVALLQQLEAGRFALDDAVTDYLPAGMHIRGEDPQRPVRFRHLLTHTSGMPVAFGGHAVWGESVPLPLEQYLADSLRVTGPPGERVVYSNLAYSLVALLVERMSGVPYREYIETRIWAPLGMHAYWLPRGDMEERLAIPYQRVDGRFTPAVRTKANVWPAGLVYGTVLDQARWVMFSLGDGAAPPPDATALAAANPADASPVAGVPDDTSVAVRAAAKPAAAARLLQPATVDSMFTLQFPQLAGEPLGGGWGYDNPGYGLTWWTSTRNGQKYFAHSGSVAGYTAFVGGNRDAGYGIALLTNGHRAHQHLARLTNLALDLLAEQHAADR